MPSSPTRITRTITQYPPFFTFPLGILLLFVSVPSFGNGYLLLGTGLVVTTLAMWSLRDGVFIDPPNRRIKSFTRSLGIPFGKWTSYERYPHIVVLRNNKVQTLNMLGAAGGILQYRDLSYEVYLASANHIHLIMIDEVRGRQQAYESAHDLASQMDLTLMRYNPGRKMIPQAISREAISEMAED